MLSRLRSTAPRTLKQQVRWLNLHEYQSLETFAEAGAIVKENPAMVVVKSQVLAGGRGLGHFKESGLQGGVHVVKDPAEVEPLAAKMLGNTLVTKQTGAGGKPCNTLLLAEKFTITRERYFAILMDRGSGGPVLIGSKVGGTSIEDIAEEDPSAIIKLPVDIIEGLSMEAATEMAVKMDFVGDRIQPAAECIMGLYATFTGCDCTMVEINPLAELSDGRVIACDAKVNFDDNAEYRQKEIFDCRDESQEDAREVAAKKWDLNYIGLDGNIACMVNGAGLAMSTMDLLQLYGGTPANFLDVGGSAKEDL